MSVLIDYGRIVIIREIDCTDLGDLSSARRFIKINNVCVPESATKKRKRTLVGLTENRNPYFEVCMVN